MCIPKPCLVLQDTLWIQQVNHSFSICFQASEDEKLHHRSVPQLRPCVVIIVPPCVKFLEILHAFLYSGSSLLKSFVFGDAEFEDYLISCLNLFLSSSFSTFALNNCWYYGIEHISQLLMKCMFFSTWKFIHIICMIM